MNNKKSLFSQVFKLFFNEDKTTLLGFTRNHPIHQIQGPLGRRADADSHIALRMSDMQDLINKE